MATDRVLVVGAGMVGVCVAWHLLRQGKVVSLIDRREPGEETSFGNAGLIQREAIKPHPFPRKCLDIVRISGNRSIDVRYSPLAMIKEAPILWDYWKASAPNRFSKIVREYASLIVHCTDDHQTLITAAGIDALIDRRGWLQIYRNREEMAVGLREAREAHERYGVEFQEIDGHLLRELEPCLSEKVVGAVKWTNSWAVSDPGSLVKAYAKGFMDAGGEFLKTEVLGMKRAQKNWRLRTSGSEIEGKTLVLAAGPWSIRMLHELGYKIPMFVQRGYHAHYSAARGAKLNFPLFDSDKGYTLTPKKMGLRLTTGAELALLDDPARIGQLRAAEEVAKEIFPLGNKIEPEPWVGSRPCIADMKPVIGPAPRHEDLWFAFGHGHQGFTLGPTTGRLLASMMDGEEIQTDMAPFRADRF